VASRSSERSFTFTFTFVHISLVSSQTFVPHEPCTSSDTLHWPLTAARRGGDLTECPCNDYKPFLRCSESLPLKSTTSVRIITLLHTLRYNCTASSWWVGVDRLAAIEDPVDDVEDSKDDWETLARQFVDSPSVVLAVVRRCSGCRQWRWQRSRHHRLRLRLLGRWRGWWRLVVPVMRRRLGGGRTRARRHEKWLIDAGYYRRTIHTAADHCRIADRRIGAAVTGSLRVLHIRNEFTYSKGSFFNPLECRGNYTTTSNNMKLVHWPWMGGLLRLVQRVGDWALRPLLAVPNVTAHPSINGQCTKSSSWMERRHYRLTLQGQRIAVWVQ